MFLPKRWYVLLLSGAVFVSPAIAQTFVAKRITFSGATQGQAELLAVSGLKPGETLGPPEIQAAAQKLIDTGMFTDVHFSFNGVELNYALKPADGMQPVAYANFPWWDEQALSAAVSAKVPLFHGEVPPESAMQQQVAAALTALVAEKGVTATVTGAPVEALGSRQWTGILYHIDAPPVEVGSVHLSGVSGDLSDPVMAIQKAAAGKDFDPATAATIETALRIVYHRQGYLEMAMTGYAHGEPQVEDGKVMVPVSATVEQGPQYRVRELRLAGDAVMTPDQFAKIAKLHLGDIANEDLLHGTLAEMAPVYKSRGYLRARFDAAPTFDAATRTVDYTVSVVPGPVFHMGTLGLENVSDQQRAEIVKAWPLKEGDVFDGLLPSAFLLRYKSQLRSLDGWSATYKAYEHEDTHVVDLVVTFRQGGPLR